MTDAPDTQAPADNSTLCLDFKLFATWQLSLVAIRILALQHLLDDVPALIYYGALLAMLAAFVLAAVEHRRTHNWRWPGLDQDAVQRSLIVAGGIFAFLLLASRAMPPFTRAGVPEIAFAFSMFAFALLYATKIAQWSRAEFEACCTTPAAATQDDDGEPGWMRFVRGAYLTAAPLVVLEAIAAFAVNIDVKQNATPVRTASHIVLLNDHGRHYWLTPGQWEMFHGLMQPLGYTVPAIVLGGLFLSHVLNVKLFPFLGGMGALFSRNDSP